MAGRLLKKYDGQKGRWLKFWKRYFLLVVLLLVCLRLLVGISRVSGDSMNPTLQDGAVVVYLRPVQHYQTGDIVSLHMVYGEYYIKRIAAVAGDTVDLRSGVLYVNGSPEAAGYAAGATEPQANTAAYPFEVPAGSVFVLGDNRETSVDSRTFGPVALSQIRGKILFHIG